MAQSTVVRLEIAPDNAIPNDFLCSRPVCDCSIPHQPQKSALVNRTVGPFGRTPSQRHSNCLGGGGRRKQLVILLLHFTSVTSSPTGKSKSSIPPRCSYSVALHLKTAYALRCHLRFTPSVTFLPVYPPSLVAHKYPVSPPEPDPSNLRSRTHPHPRRH
ncbi:hypothetical protein VTO42DRAFT_3465 [Malbranchea cinnamomea]